MAKYYVSSGSMKVVMAGPHVSGPLEAAKEVCLAFCRDTTTLDTKIKVSQIGFDEHDKDKHYDTQVVLRKAGFELE